MITIILAEPEHPGNIGSVCRVMQNFGFTELVLINPKCEINQEARNLAKNAQSVLQHARIADWSVLEEFSVIAATAGKTTTDYNIPRTALSPEDAVEKLAKVKNAALLFGRESTGLTNKELEKADFVITIPTHPSYPSMNLSHSVAVVLYELFLQQPRKKFTPINASERKALEQKLDKLVEEPPFSTEGKRKHQREVWKNIFGRATLTKREAYACLGLFSALERRQNLLCKVSKQGKARRR